MSRTSTLRLGTLSRPASTPFDFKYDGGGMGKGGIGTINVDGKEVAKGRIGSTTPVRFSLDETFDIGEDTSTPVSEDYDIHRSDRKGLRQSRRTVSANGKRHGRGCPLAMRGGSIEVDTQLGEFTDFRIVLPRIAAAISQSGNRP